MVISQALRALAEKTISRAIAVQQIPAPTFAESDRASAVADELRRLVAPAGGSVDITGAASGGGEGEPVNVIATIPGPAGVSPLLISAHTDTVFPAYTDLSVTGSPSTPRVAGPGIGDNSLAVGALLSVAEVLGRQSALPVPVVLLANAGEEGRGDLCGINAALDLLDDRSLRPAAAIVLEGLALGRVYHAGIGVKRYEISVRGPGGHSWGDAGTPSAVHELAVGLARLCELELPEEPRSTLNIGVISGGRSINTIADFATAELDLRSATAAGIDSLDRTVREQLERWSPGEGLSKEIDVIGARPAGAIGRSHPLVQAALEAATEVPAKLQSGSTDANALFARGIAAVCVGVSTGANAHRLDEYIETMPAAAGLSQLGRLIERAAEMIADGTITDGGDR